MHDRGERARMGKWMSETDDWRAGIAAAEDPPPAVKPPFRCEAHELKSILQRIASHISEADRRHSEALDAMQERLLLLSREAAEARSRMPKEMSPEIDRIEDDMVMLAERMAAEAGPAGEDLDELTEGDASSDAEPWDRASAEALANVYESEASGFGARSSRTGEEAEGQPPWGSKPAEAHPVGAEGRLLERKCAEIAQRVEQALAEIRRECAFVDLGSRFEKLEVDVGRALAAAGDRAEKHVLERIEAQLAELGERFDAVQAHASRLDRIEKELRALGQQMSDEHMSELLARAAAAVPGTPPEAVARLVADRVCAQLPQSDEARAEERKRLEELHEAVNGFFSERRDSDAQTATVLETMQHALIRLLERMDAVEDTAPGMLIPRASPSQAPEPSVASNLDQWGTASEREVRAAESREPRYDPAIYHMYPEPGSSTARRQAEAETATQRKGGPPRPAEAQPTSWHGDRLGYVPPQQDAQNVVAAARRAMRYAAQTESGEEVAPGGGERATKPPKPAEKRGRGPFGGSWFPSRLFLATVAVVVVGTTFAIATVLRKPAAEAPGGRMLLVPEGATIEQPKQDAGRGEPGRPIDRSGEPQGQPESGDRRAPALKQRSGEPSKRMHALGVDRLEWGFGQVSAFEAGARSDAGQGGRAGGEGPHPAPEAPAVALPRGVAPQETGSIGGAPATRPQLANPASPTAVPSALVPGAAEAGRPARAHSLSGLPPAAVGPHSLRIAAVNGDPSAAFEVGARLAEGRGLPQDFEQAAAWYQRAAERGFAPAQYRLATLLERGLGVSSDPASARTWYLRAAEQGHAKAMHNVAVLSIGGDRGAPDYGSAVDWFTKAAEHGLADSQYNLGVLHESGLGVPRDLKTAYRWFALAAQAGDEQALRRRDLLGARIAPAELQEVEGAIKTWRAKPADPQINEPRTAGTLWQRDPAASGAQ
jgi:localization factor PodJL